MFKSNMNIFNVETSILMNMLEEFEVFYDLLHGMFQHRTMDHNDLQFHQKFGRILSDSVLPIPVIWSRLGAQKDRLENISNVCLDDEYWWDYILEAFPDRIFQDYPLDHDRIVRIYHFQKAGLCVANYGVTLRF